MLRLQYIPGDKLDLSDELLFKNQMFHFNMHPQVKLVYHFLLPLSDIGIKIALISLNEWIVLPFWEKKIARLVFP